jgi:hypothetical protein
MFNNRKLIIRERALQLALEHLRTLHGAEPKLIVLTAREFEAYLSGEADKKK